MLPGRWRRGRDENQAQNLKKVLSLVLCVAMMLSVMVVGAGAAFSDQSKIKNTEAVDACTALNIIGGYPDGSFKPEGNITRAEVTKMICVALNGGKNPAVSTNTTPTFSDVRNNANAAWAEGYIESCAAQGIVSGVGGGKFAPNGNVTGVQLAKMLLVSLGYKSENEGFTGNAWATNVNVRAAQKGLYDGLEAMDTNVAITRDNAARMVWNALQAYEVEYKTNLVAGANGQLSTQVTVQDKVVGSNNDKITLLRDKYDAWTNVGTLTNVSKKTIKISMNSADRAASDLYNKNDTRENQSLDFSKLDTDYSALLGQKVKVIFKNGKTNDVIGVYATGDNTAYSTIMNNVDSDGAKIKFDGKSYSVDSSIDTYIDGAAKGDKNSAYFVSAATPDKVTFVDTDDNDKIDTAVVTTVSVKKVTYVSSSSIIAGGQTYKYADDNIAKDLKKDDFVVITKDLYNDCNDIVKAKKKQVKISGYKDKDNNSTVNVGDEYQIDGTWYKVATGADLDTNVKVGNTADIVTVNGMLFYTDKVSGVGTSADLAFVVAKGSSIYGDQAKLMFLDGTTKVVTIDDDSDTWNAGQFYEYSISGDEYKLETLGNADTEYGDYKVAASNADIQTSNDKITTITTTTTSPNKNSKVADSAKVIVWVTNSDSSVTDVKMITGKQLKSLNATTTHNNINNKALYTFTSDIDGLTQVSLVAVKFNNTSGTFNKKLDNLTTDAHYGYITSDAYKIDNGYIQFTMWDGTNDQTVKFKTSSTADFVKGAVVGYDTLSDGEIKGLKKVNMTAGAITGVNDKGDKIVINDASEQLKIDSDVTVLYVNSGADTDKGEKIGVTGSLEKASKVLDKTGATIYNTNLLYNGDGTSTTDVIVVDVTGKFDSAVYGNALTIPTTGVEVTDSDGKILSSGDKVMVGDILTIKNTDTATKTVGTTNAVGTDGGDVASNHLKAGETVTVIVRGEVTITVS